VAYADFVTAMMAFFLLMWLLNATTEEQRQGLADYFAPANVFGRSQSGSGAPFGGSTPHQTAQMSQDAGAITVQRGPLPVLPDVEIEDDSTTPARPIFFRDAAEGEDEDNAPRTVRTARADAPPGDQDPRARRAELPPHAEREGPGQGNEAPTLSDAELRAEYARRELEAIARALVEGAPAQGADARSLSDSDLRGEFRRREREAFERAAEDIRRAVAADPALAELGQQLRIEQTPEGLRIQLLDAERQPMFALGGAAPNDRARQLIASVAQVAQRLPNSIGYVEYAYAKQNKMSYMALRNQTGSYVIPTDTAFKAAAAGAEWTKSFYQVLTDQPGKDSWPITGATFILMHKVQDKPVNAANTLKFFDWTFVNGDKMADDLDYVPLPASVKDLIRNQWASQLKDASGKTIAYK
jgi:flagellar motor protein MotB